MADRAGLLLDVLPNYREGRGSLERKLARANAGAKEREALFEALADTERQSKEDNWWQVCNEALDAIRDFRDAYRAGQPSGEKGGGE